MEPTTLPAIPAKRYFTIGEVSELCAVKPYVLRYWEQEFSQLRPMKRRGNRRYYQHHEVMLVRRIRELLYEQGFTISGARNRLAQAQQAARAGAGAARAAQQDDVDLDTSALGPMTGGGIGSHPSGAISTQIAASLSAVEANGHAGASKALRAVAPQASSNGISMTSGLATNGAHANLGSGVVSDLALQREALRAELQAIRALLDD